MPTDLRQQIARREAIVQILGNSEITRQDDLVRALADRGLDATQSSISRDLKELGVAKVGERYVAPQNVRVPGNPPFELLAGFVKNLAAAGPNITVIRTATGAAQSVAVALDKRAGPKSSAPFPATTPSLSLRRPCASNKCCWPAWTPPFLERADHE